MKEVLREIPLHKDATEFRMWLQEEYAQRCRRNPHYSLRAFAALLKVDSSSVSQLLSGKRRASKKLVVRICECLDAHPLTVESLLKNLKPAKATGSRRSQSKSGSPKDDSIDEQADYRQLTLDAFAVVADWYHYAILELTTTQGFKSNNQWIARALGISVTEVKVSIERMKRLELIEEKNGKLIQCDNSLSNGVSGISTSGAHKQLQRQVLQKALDAIDNIEPEKKDITSMTMAIDPAKVPEARKLIRQFRRDLCQFLESEKRKSVYNLGIQLYPVSKRID